MNNVNWFFVIIGSVFVGHYATRLISDPASMFLWGGLAINVLCVALNIRKDNE